MPSGRWSTRSYRYGESRGASATAQGVGRPWTTGSVSRGSCGSSGRGPSGANCPRDMGPRAPSIAAPALDGGRNAGTALASLSGPAPGTGAHPLERVLRRWDVRLGEKRGLLVGKTKRGKGTKLVVLVDGQRPPLGLHMDAASPSEVRRLVQTLETVRVARLPRGGRPRQRPERLIADKGYDSNAVRELLEGRGIEPIIPARANNTVATHQDGRTLRWYRRWWIVERTISWL